MADVTRKRQGEIMKAVFSVLGSAPEGLPASEVIERVARALTLTPFEAEDYPNRPASRRFDRILRFATIPFVKAGWLTKSKGQWQATPEGLRADREHPDPEAFMRKAISLYKQWKQARVPADEEAGNEGVESVTTLEEAEETAWREISDYVAAMPPYDFQTLVAGLLKAMGYFVHWIAPPGPDRGIDILASTDPLGVKEPRIKVQVKRRQDKVTVDGVRSFLAVPGERDVGIFVSIGGFTTDAENEVRSQSVRRVTLLDLEKLFDLWVTHYTRVDEERRQLLPLRPIHYLAVPQ